MGVDVSIVLGRSWRGFALLVAVAATACGEAQETVAQEQLATTGVFVTAVDTQLVEGSSTNYGTKSTVGVRGDGPTTTAMVGLLKFTDLPDLPGSFEPTVSSASLTLNIASTSESSYCLYSAGTDWSETEANWTNATSTTTWHTPGGDHFQCLQEFTPSSTGQMTIVLGSALRGFVATWLAFPSGNHGLLIGHPSHHDGFTFRAFNAADPANSPTLSATWQERE